MVASIAALKSAGQAGKYYDLDDYYAEEDRAPSAWAGRGADELSLVGAVDREQFNALLHGQLPGGARLGAMRGGKIEHRPGWDITHSAPKSISIMAEVAGDRRLVAAHDAAVLIAQSQLERHAIATRVRTRSAIETVTTGKAVIASFRHNTSRALDPQLHTHSVMLNATLDDAGQWRSLESLPLYEAYKDNGAIYRQALAMEVKALGYELRESPGSMFELDCVPPELIKLFSTRAGQVEARLAEIGKTRANTSSAQKSMIALDTRSRKIAADRGVLVNRWRDEAAAVGFDADVRRHHVSEAIERVARLPKLTSSISATLASEAVAYAASSLSERNSVFSVAQLEKVAGEFAFGKTALGDVVNAIAGAEATGDLIARKVQGGPVGRRRLSTKAAVEAEQRMLSAEAQSRNSVVIAVSRMEASRLITKAALASASDGHEWNDQQRAATRQLLTSQDRVVAVQGYAGTAKTTTVMATYAEGMRLAGFDVRGFASTVGAARELGKAIDMDTESIAWLRARGKAVVKSAKPGREVWIIDEASMVSAVEMDDVLGLAARAQARVVLVGDVAQLGSVEAGCAFAQLQHSGMTTIVLDKIVRQTNEMTKEAVEATIAKDAKRAFEALDRGGGKVIELADSEDRYAAIANEYAGLTQKERARTLVMDPSRDGRERLTDAIREALLRDGTLGDDVIRAKVLEARGLTKAEASRAASYATGDVVTFRRAFKSHRVSAGEGYRVVEIHSETNRIVLSDSEGASVNWQLDKWGRGQAEAFKETERDFRVGDRLQFTRNNKAAGRVNGGETVVVALDPERSRIITRSPGVKSQTLDLVQTKDRHFRHGWVRTIHSAQGATADRVFAHLESFRLNTVNTKSAYVAISRARKFAAIFTDNRSGLADAMNVRLGEKESAISYENIDKIKTNQHLEAFMA